MKSWIKRNCKRGFSVVFAGVDVCAMCQQQSDGVGLVSINRAMQRSLADIVFMRDIRPVCEKKRDSLFAAEEGGLIKSRFFYIIFCLNFCPGIQQQQHYLNVTTQRGLQERRVTEGTGITLVKRRR